MVKQHDDKQHHAASAELPVGISTSDNFQSKNIVNEVAKLTNRTKNKDGSFSVEEVVEHNGSYVDFVKYVEKIDAKGHVQVSHHQTIATVQSEKMAEAVEKLVLELDAHKKHGENTPKERAGAKELFESIKEAAHDHRFDAHDVANVVATARKVSTEIGPKR